MPKKDRLDQTVNGKKLWMDFLVLDMKHENAYIFGYDGELTMKIPRSAFWHIVDQVEEGVLKHV